MSGTLRYLAPMVGACLMSAPAAAQTAGVANATAAVSTAEPLSAAETVWHMRAALNVAALACRDADAEETVRLYNAMLRDAAAPLAEAAAGTEQAYRKRYAAQWQDAEDGAMTRLYNGYAVQNGHAAFCATARTVLRRLSSIEPSDFVNFAAEALVRLEAPFAAPAPGRIEVHTAPPLEVAVLRDGGGNATPRPMTIAFAD